MRRVGTGKSSGARQATTAGESSGVIPACGAFISWLWTLACTFVAIRQGLDLDNTKALLIAVVALIVVVIFYFIIFAIMEALGIGIGGVLDSIYS